MAKQPDCRTEDDSPEHGCDVKNGDGQDAGD